MNGIELSQSLKRTLIIIWLILFTVLSCKKNSTADGGPPTPKILLPTLATYNPSLVTPSNATIGGNISSDGGASVTSRGVCWSITQNPTINDSKTTDGVGTGAFTSAITGLTLTGNTVYYVRAYATNSVGTGYGNQITLSAKEAATVPTVKIDVSAIFYNRAVIQATITASGAQFTFPPLVITAFGVCWGTAPNPTIANNKTTDTLTNGGSNSFLSGVTNLTVNTTYYLRAYATNSVGTAYSAQVTFTTAYQIGQAFQGGLIFFIDATKMHGYIVSTADQSPGALWDNTIGTFASPGAYSATDGPGNTTKIVSTFGNGGNAAAICQAYTGGGYNDWYLPASAELTLLYANKNLVYPDPSVAGSFSATYYWSSTESTSYIAFATSIFFGSISATLDDITLKTTYYPVRAIRAF
jgi:hypothetical protein